MDEQKRTPPDDCQLQVLINGTAEIGRTDKMRTVAFRLLSAAERRINRVREMLGQPGERLAKSAAGKYQLTADQGAAAVEAGGAFKPGDVIEVLSLGEIKTTLDEAGNCDGLHFMEGMEIHCGKRFAVRKRVRNMFDERAWRMVRIRNAYILDGVICEGRGLYDKEGCDRCCFFFWKDRWLRKVEKP
jgi:hypothetical protein